jgi:hypothetical protein
MMQCETEGKARKLSDAMIDALQLCADAVSPVYGINKSVAVALLLRGMIALDKPNQHPSYDPAYWITPHGRRALSISLKGRRA